MYFLVQIVFGLVILLNASQSFSDTHGTVTGTTNYIGRGFTKSDNDFAIQANLDYQNESGIYLGASASNVNFGDRNFNDSSRVEFAPYFGYTHKLTDDWHADVQWTRYLYDGKIFGRDSDYNEFYLFLHYRDLLTLRASISDSFYGSDVVSGDYELTVRYPLTEYLEVSSGVGYLQAKKVLGWDYLYWNVGITGRYKFISADLRYVESAWTTDFFKTSWDYAPDSINARLVFSLTVGF
jgi:uncharacterized protein (TIGR02001 family)